MSQHRSKGKRKQINSTNVNDMPNLLPEAHSSQTNTIDNSFHTTLPMISIQPFDGSPENLEFFISQVKDLASLSKWQEQFTIAYVKSKLTGNALKFIQQSAALHSLTSADQIFQLLTDFFKHSSPANDLIQYQSFCMLPGESIKNLSHRLNYLTNKVYNEITDTNALDQIKFTKFTQVIPGEIRLPILQAGIKSYDEAVAKATTIQDCIAQNNILNGTSQIHDSDPQINNIQMQLTDLNQQIKALNEHQAPSKDAREHQQSNYVNKHNKNHRQSFRPFRRQEFRPWRNNRGHSSHNRVNYRRNFSARSHTSQDRCQLCDQYGHSAPCCTVFNISNNLSPRNLANTNVNRQTPNANVRF